MTYIKKFKKIYILLVALLVLGVNLYFIPSAFAGTLTKTQVLELGTSTSCAGSPTNANPMIAGDAQCLAIEFTPASTYVPSSGGAGQVQLTFNSWTGGSAAVNTTQTAATNGCSGATGLFPGSPTALPGTLTAAGSGSVITISGVTSITSGTTYCTELTNASSVTNPPAGSYTVSVSTGTDNQTVALDVLTAGQNAYGITATVSPTFTMSLSGTTDSITTLALGSIKTSTGITTTVVTNAKSGWIVWVDDLNAGLTSTQAGHTIASGTGGVNHTLTAGTEGYALAGSVVTGSPSIAPPYQTTGSNGGGLSNTTFYEVASDGSPASNDQFKTQELVAISGTTPPATDYTDTITLTGAGSF